MKANMTTDVRVKTIPLKLFDIGFRLSDLGSSRDKKELKKAGGTGF